MTGARQHRHRSGPQVEELAGRLRAVITRLAVHLRTPATRGGVTPTQFAALSILAAGPRRPGQLAHDLGLSAPAVSGLTRVLILTGWVTRKRDPGDQRAHLLRLTAAGSTALDGFRTQGARQLAEDLDALPAEQQTGLAAVLPVLESLADRYAAPAAGNRYRAHSGRDPALN